MKYIKRKAEHGVKAQYIQTSNHNALFPHDCVHVENLSGGIGAPELQNRRLVPGSFPWKFQGGEAALCRAVAFDGAWPAEV